MPRTIPSKLPNSSRRSSESSQVKTVPLKKNFSRGILANTIRSCCSLRSHLALLSSWRCNRSRHFPCQSRPAVPFTLLSNSAYALSPTVVSNCLSCWWVSLTVVCRQDVKIMRSTGWMLQFVCKFFVSMIVQMLLYIELNWIYWQTANEGRPRPEEIIGNAKINTKEKW